MRDDIYVISGVCDWNTSSHVPVVDPRLLHLNNGNYNLNFIVEDFEVFPSTPNTITHNLIDNTTSVVLATKESGAIAATSLPSQPGRGMTVADNRQIGWSIFSSTYKATHIEDGHLIVNDLYVNAWVKRADDGTLQLPCQAVNYIITLRRVVTSTEQAIFALIQERAQDDISHA